MRPISLFAATLALALGGSLLLPACSPQDPSDSQRSVTRLAEPEDVLSEPLMIALSQAKNFHHKADVYLRDGKFAEATESLTSILSIPFPAGSAEGEDVVLDARARLGKLYIRQGELDPAFAVVDRGIAAATRESFFLANLHRVRGEIFEARAELLDEQGDPEAARAARVEAIQAFDRSIVINEKLLSNLSRESGR